MGYVAVKGGTSAIEESIKLLKYERLKKGTTLNIKNIEGGMRSLIDQIMSESSLYSETLAAIAIKQAEGSPEEAVFLLRAYRSTLPRKHYSRTVNTEEMSAQRRISASFKDIPGGQILGACYDYTHRLIDFDLVSETKEDVFNWTEWFNEENSRQSNLKHTDMNRLPKVLEYLRKEGLLEECEKDDTPPHDITQKSVQFPTKRSERLQILTRGQTGAVTSLGYAALRGYGALHPTVGEVRVGMIGIYVDNPLNKPNGQEDDSYYIGDIKVTEVETLFPSKIEKANGEKELQFKIGYGICYGQNETKAIAMSLLDRCLEAQDLDYPTHNEEFVLLHVDSVESTGFISHLKLPHYVTFQSKLDSARKSRKTMGEYEQREAEAYED